MYLIRPKAANIPKQRVARDSERVEQKHTGKNTHETDVLEVVAQLDSVRSRYGERYGGGQDDAEPSCRFTSLEKRAGEHEFKPI